MKCFNGVKANTALRGQRAGRHGVNSLCTGQSVFGVFDLIFHAVAAALNKHRFCVV